ncbi:MAG: hypothetical protein NTX52_02430 [Planctomycetota bacterium]|nr:hypothetical protein [Planctomycetota bacterium]
MSKYITVAMVFLMPLQVGAAEHPSVSDLLDKYQVARESLRSFIVKNISTIVENDTVQGRRMNREVSEFRTDGDRVDCHVYWWTNLATEDEPATIEKGSYKSFIWDSESFFEYRRGNDIDGVVFIDRHDDRKREQISIVYGGAPLTGIFNGDLDPVSSILHQADTISVRNKMEQVGGSECYVIDAVTQSGKYVVWIDPQHGYNIAKAEVYKEENDVAWGKPLGWQGDLSDLQFLGPRPVPLNSFSFTLKNVRFEKINDIWVPMEADYENTKTYTNGRIITTRMHDKRTYIDCAPDFEAVGAFVPDIPDGSRVFLEYAPGIRYVWQNGKPVPDVDQRFLDVLDNQIEQIKSKAKTESTRPTVKQVETSLNEPEVTIGTQPKVEVNISETPRQIPAASTPSPIWAFLSAGVVIIGVIIWLIFRRCKA